MIICCAIREKSDTVKESRRNQVDLWAAYSKLLRSIWLSLRGYWYWSIVFKVVFNNVVFNSTEDKMRIPERRQRYIASQNILEYGTVTTTRSFISESEGCTNSRVSLALVQLRQLLHGHFLLLHFFSSSRCKVSRRHWLWRCYPPPIIEYP